MDPAMPISSTKFGSNEAGVDFGVDAGLEEGADISTRRAESWAAARTCEKNESEKGIAAVFGIFIQILLIRNSVML